MKRFVLTLLALAMIFTMTSGRACALEFKEMLKEVLETHPQVDEKLKAYNASVHEKAYYEAGYRPKVTLEAEAGYQDVSNSNTGYSHEDDTVSGGRIHLKQMIYDGSRVKNDVAIRESQARSELFRYCDTANNVAFSALENYVTVLKNQALEKLAQEDVDTHLMILKNVKFLFRSGKGGISQLNRVQGRLAAAQSKLLARRNDYKQAVYNFHKIFGRFLDADEMRVPRFDNHLLPADFKEAFTRQMQNHPTLIAADFNLEAKKRECDREKSNYKPTLYLEASHSLQRNYSGISGDDNESQVLLKAYYSLYDGGARRAMTQKITSQVHSRKAVRARVQRTVINDLQLTWTGYKLLDAQISALRKNLFFTREALSAYKGEFKLGKRDLINILDAENEYQNAKALLEATQFDLLVSQYRILHAMGTLINDMGLTSALLEELKDVKAVRPASRDVLPLDLDLDQDGIPDIEDISTNSHGDQQVNFLGAEEGKTVSYLTDEVSENKSEIQSLVRKKTDINHDTFKPDVAIILDMISFEKKSIELSHQSKLIMRKLLEQLRPLSREGMVQITVNTSEMETPEENYRLALQRAYNIMKIFSMHNINADTIRVFAGIKAQGQNENNISLKVISNLEDFKRDYHWLNTDKIRFETGKVSLTETSKNTITLLAKEITQLGNPPADIVVYSNDLEGESRNIDLSAKRASEIQKRLIENGCNPRFMVPVAWGSYRQTSDLFETPENNESKVTLVVREPITQE